MKTGIAGLGMVGGAMQRWFASKKTPLYLYDKYKQIGSPEELNEAECIYICVPTPTDKNGCDTSAVEEIISLLEEPKIVVIKCTVPPGTTKKLQEQYPQHRLLHNPEFLTEATADQDMAYPDRQIIGYTKQSFTIAKDILMELPLAPFERIVESDVSEAVKYFNNTWFSVKVIFANQFYDVCKAAGIDYEQVREIAAADKRVERTHLDVWHKFEEKGHRGAAGKCLPKDLKAFIRFAKKNDVDPVLLEVTDELNEAYKAHGNV